MYCNKENVNILTALLAAHGIDHAVLCPGSRNAPIVHNLHECPDIQCYPVTDERSAGFYALGMAQALNKSVAVCVTSGTALLNLAPAMAEAYYQHVPLVVISADRPPQWIDQLDGQTLPQLDALGRFVKKAVTLPEPHDEEERWFCNRLVNEALIETHHHGYGPVHINVPISEPLFDFNVKELPEERTICLLNPRCYQGLLLDCVGQFCLSKKPMVVIGQIAVNDLLPDDLLSISACAVVLHESLSVGNGGTHFDEILDAIGTESDYMPDFVLYLGDTMVSKRIKRFLRNLKDAHIWAVTEDGSLHDTSMNLYGIIEGHPADVLNDLVDSAKMKVISGTSAFKERWSLALQKAADHARTYAPAYSQMTAVKNFEQRLTLLSSNPENEFFVHYANSSSVRLANIYAQHYVYCNRGVNGIEGSLSTAAGFSCVTDENVFCVIGDLSFFYDQNALWNQNLKGNLHILLLNNGCGGIFNTLKGLEGSPARSRFVAAEHHTTAEGICQQNDVVYLQAKNMDEMQQGIDTLLSIKSNRPVLLEVFTEAQTDAQVIQEYYSTLKH